MGVFVRAVISGFGFSLGAALFKKLSRTVGFEEGAGDSEKRGDRSDPDTTADGDSAPPPDGEQPNAEDADEPGDELH